MTCVVVRHGCRHHYSDYVEQPLVVPRDHCDTNTHEQDALNHRGNNTADQQERHGPTEDVSAIMTTVAEYKRRTSPQKSQETVNNPRYHLRHNPT